MTDGLGAWAFGYDANSQLTSVDGPWSDDTITYVPDDLGRITQMQPQGGTAVNYVYDALDRLTQIQRGAESFVYTYSGVNPLVQQLTRPNGSATEYQYNALNQLTEILNRTSSGDVLSRHKYTYNGQDLRASEIFAGAAIPPAPAVPDTNTTYTTNDVNQLLNTVGPDRTFQYDDDGNLTQGYTKDGYMFTATYDAENRMTSIQYTGSGSIVHRQVFRYRGDGLLADLKRYQKGALAETVRFVRDGMLAIQDRNASNAVVREYTWGLNLGGGIGGLLNLNSAGQNYAYLYDGKGNVEAVLDAAQQVVAAYRYDPFGVLLAKTGTFEQPFGFSTKRTDAGTGIVFFQYRPYGPDSGTWLTRDPLGEAGGLNLYAFVGNNPVNWVDPWGLTEAPSLPGQVIVKQNGVTIEHYGTISPVEHGPAHAHVTGGGRTETRIGPKGYPLKNDPPLTPKQLAVVNKNRGIIRKVLNKLGRANMRLENAATVLGLLGLVVDVANVIDAQARAEESGISVWYQMTLDYYEGLGYTIIYPRCPDPT